MHRMARVVDWPARIAVSLGGGALLTLYLEFLHPRTHAGIRWFDDVRAGAVAALLFGGGLLTLGWAQRRWREYGRSREKRRAIRLATLMQHADPVTAQVSEHEKRFEGLEAGQRAVEMKVDNLLATFADVLEGHGDAPAALQKTMPMLRLVVDNSAEEKKDSA